MRFGAIVLIVMIGLAGWSAAEEITYTRAHPEAKLIVTWTEEATFRIRGEAWWKGPGEGQIHFGHITGQGELDGPDNSAAVVADDSPCRLRITFAPKQITVKETSPVGSCGGSNVSFDGLYRRGSISSSPSNSRSKPRPSASSSPRASSNPKALALRSPAS